MSWRMLFTASLFFVAFSSSLARADYLNVSLAQATQTVSQGTTVVGFVATLSNPTGDTIYLNSDSSSTSSLAVTVDDSPFSGPATVWPFFLAPSGQAGDSFTGLLFNLDLASNLAPGLYTGVFSIQGGPDGGTFTDFSDLADAYFTIDVATGTATPEPSNLLLLGSGLLGWSFLGLYRRL